MYRAGGKAYLTMLHLIQNAAVSVIQNPARVALLLPALEGLPRQAAHLGLMLLADVALQVHLLCAVVHQSCIATQVVLPELHGNIVGLPEVHGDTTCPTMNSS